eukprot:CAMPEP_0202102336 /NCGR_PEP_ID=MMETSP0965-20130614/4247_1 /ASSEMBLY_ACC=CAM_ASM_000507 /TAXON_ID=4773 /ORGANISM="Schizochytrium aggregatum, Strain ATCC28209" /LENGTH=50 /DNA_ID=CAMNT_0048671091 /DNA_START=305 /DNA_END=454 /DNA_ORIENTATION=-
MYDATHQGTKAILSSLLAWPRNSEDKVQRCTAARTLAARASKPCNREQRD